MRWSRGAMLSVAVLILIVVTSLQGHANEVLVSAWGSNNVLRYNATTGAFIDEFVVAGDGTLDKLHGMNVGPRPGQRGVKLVRETTRPVYEFIDGHLEQPFFLWLLYMDPVLPFGLRSTPKTFSALADTMQACLTQMNPNPI